MTATEALERLGGIAGAASVIQLSSRRRLRTSVANGSVLKLGPNRYALPTSQAGLAAAVALRGHLSHLTAAAHWGWEIWQQPPVASIVVPASSTVLSTHCDLRRTDLKPGEVDGWATSKMRTVLDCARDLPFTAALAVADSAMRHGDVLHEELVSAAKREPEHVRRVAEWADPRPANPFESALRALTVQAGLLVVPQFATTCGEQTYHPDLANPFLGIAVEAESWGFHSDKETHDRDCVRFNAMTAAGWLVLRFTWNHVMWSPSYVMATIQEAITEKAA
nr:DUF559 domain-containing protein [Nocardioides thalensis]